MKQSLITFIMLVCCSMLHAQTNKENFDFGWKFIEGDKQDAMAVVYDDSQWTAVNLPHDWDISHAPSADAPMGNDGGYYAGGVGWYRKSFNVKAMPKTGEHMMIHFEGVYQKSRVYVNGQEAGTHGYGYTPYLIDITPYVHKGKNVVAVRVDNSLQPNCRWYSGSGIYRHVWLETYRDGSIDNPRKLYLSTLQIDGISADATRADSAVLCITYDNNEIERRTFHDVKLWSPEHPMLYDIKVGEISVKHGFRTFEYDAQNGARLNGQLIKLNGACVHHDDGLLGAMAFDKAEIRKVRLMKDAGFNLIRTSHNPSTRAFLDACDSIGMMVIDEAFDGWRTAKTRGDYSTLIDSCYTSDIQAMVLRDRNHPSIICWSIGNEVIERKDIRVIKTARDMKAVVTMLDSTRPVTEALCSWDDDWDIYDPHADVLDIVGYNYMMHKHESDHMRCPERVMWQTESYPRDAFLNWKRTHDNAYIIGDIVWTGLDYLGESGIGQFYYEGEPRGEHYQGKHFPFHGAYCGDVDITGWRKPISHYRDILWNANEGDNSTIYLAVREPDYYHNGHITETQWSVWPTWESWNWTGHEGKTVDVEVYTKAPRVKLYVNDKLIATKEVSINTEYKAVIPVEYTPGSLKAVAVNADGKDGASMTLSTAGEPYAIKLTPDAHTMKADGEDISYITMEVVDKDMRLVPDASVTVDVSVIGAGQLLSAGSANFKDLEPMTSSHVTTYKGRATIVVRSTKKKGNVIVKTKCKLKNPEAKTTIVAK